MKSFTSYKTMADSGVGPFCLVMQILNLVESLGVAITAGNFRQVFLGWQLLALEALNCGLVLIRNHQCIGL